MFLYIDPLKQGLKQRETTYTIAGNKPVFIHRSIKTRIETPDGTIIAEWKNWFLYIDPLKQGLKRYKILHEWRTGILFLYIDPLKQGLKLIKGNIISYSLAVFLYIDPLKQGLKHSSFNLYRFS